MNKIILLSLSAAFMLSTKFSYCQELRRSASFGAAVGNINDSLKSALKLSSLSGTIINKVIEGTAAEKAGFTVNDVLVSLNEDKIENAAHFIRLLKNHYGGDEVKIGYYRNSKHDVLKMTLLPKKMETSEEFDIIYSSVQSAHPAYSRALF